MNFKNGKSKTRTTLVDISPLIDVVFLLLIFFMVSTTFIDEAGLPLDLPSSVSKGIKKTENVSISISKDGFITIGEEKVDKDKLVEKIKEKLEKSEKKEVIIKADKDARYELVYLVMDSSRQAGAKALSVAGKKK
jgi:biopolymer transport protein ExbD